MTALLLTSRMMQCAYGENCDGALLELPAVSLNPEDAKLYPMRATLRCHLRERYSSDLVHLCKKHYDLLAKHRPTKWCSDPFDQHVGKKLVGTRTVGEQLCRKVEDLGGFCAPRDVLCTPCRDGISRRFTMAPGNLAERPAEAPAEGSAGPSHEKRRRVDVEANMSSQQSTSSESPDSEEWKFSQDMTESPQTRSAKIQTITKHLQALGCEKLTTDRSIERRPGYIAGYLYKSTGTLQSLLESVLLPKHMQNQTDLRLNPDLDAFLDDLRGAIGTAKTRADTVSLLTLAPASWSVARASEYFGVRKYHVRLAKNLKNRQGILARPPPRAGKRLSEHTVDKVISFYRRDDVSRVNPATRSCVRQGGYQSFSPGRRLFFTIRETYRLFKEAHPDSKVGFSCFARLRPSEVRLTTFEQKVCVCIVCQNLKLMLNALGADSAETLASMGRCSSERVECMLDECNVCTDDGVNAQFDDITEGCLKEEVSYWTWTVKDGRCQLVKEKIIIECLLKNVKARLKKFRVHHFVKTRQAAFLSDKIKHLQVGECLVQLDFAENFAFTLQDEVQSHYYSRDQCSILTCVVYYQCDGTVQHESFCGFSEDRLHDVAPMILGVSRLLRMVAAKMHISTITYFTDGAPQHFKNRLVLWFTLHHSELFGMPATWHYHASHHGKSACDGVGAVMKRSLRHYSLKKGSSPIQSVEEVMVWAANHPMKTRVFHIPFRDVVTLRQLISQYKERIPVVKGITSFHSAEAAESSLLMRRTSSGDVCATVSRTLMYLPGLVNKLRTMLVAAT